MPPTPLVIGLAGGTGSGKTTVASVILQQVDADRIAYVPHDAYYKSAAEIYPAQPEGINWDHPDALDTDLMIAHVAALKAGQAVALPVYDFTANQRTAATRPVAPLPIILVEGILIFANAGLRALFDM